MGKPISLLPKFLSVTLFLLLATISAMAAVPRAHHLYISGATAGANPANFTAMESTMTLRVWYTYAGSPAEAGTTFQWYTYNDEFGGGKAAIGGATASTFTLTNTQLGKYIGVEVRPRNADGFGPIVEFKAFDATHLNTVLPNADSCNKAGGGVVGPANNLDSSAPLCSPRPTSWEVSYTGIDWSSTRGPRIVINWGDGLLANYTPVLVNQLLTKNDTLNLTNQAAQLWRTTQPHTYDYAGGSAASTVAGQRCTYTIGATWARATVSCSAFGLQTQPFTVWDKEDNAALGTLDINQKTAAPGPISGGVPSGEETLICEKDQTPVIVQDASVFNCTNPLETVRVNDEARWVQFIYGTSTNVVSGPGATEKFMINGVPYTTADLPVYGRVVYQAASTTAPLPSITDGISMPTTGTSGQTFVITMRTWNTCNRFDRNVADANGLNPPQTVPFNVFDFTKNNLPPSPPGTGTNQPSLIAQFTLGAAPFYANNAPVTRIYTIRIITKPPLPVAVNKEFCAGTSLNPGSGACGTLSAAQQQSSFELTAAGVATSTTISWYFGDPRSGGVAINGNANVYTGGTNCRFFRPAGLATGIAAQNAMRNALSAGTPGVYSLWATYTVANGCTSDPVEVKLTIRPVLTAPGAPTGTSPVCNNSTVNGYAQGGAATPVTIATNTLSNPAPVPFGTEYFWDTNTTGVTTSASTGTTVDVSYAIAPQPEPSASVNIRTALRYTNSVTYPIAPATNPLNFCQTTSTSLPVTVFGNSAAGDITPSSKTICSGDNTGTITVVNTVPLPLRGNVIRWEVSTTSAVAGFSDSGLGAVASINPALTTGTSPTIYYFRAIVRNGPVGRCADAISPVSTITVNPIPFKPTITPSGATTFCEGGSVTLSSSTAANVNSYQWYLGGVAISGATSQTHVVNTVAQNGSYTVQTFGVNPSNCPSIVSDPVVVTINPLASATVSGGGAVCAGTPAPNIVWTLVGTQPFNLSYTDGTTIFGPFVVNANTFTITSPATAGNYKLTALSDNSGCPTNPAGLGGTAVVTTTATPAPFMQTFTATAAVCNDGSPGTNPPDAILNLSPDLVANYDITYTINGNTFNLNGVASDNLGQITLSPPYSAWGNAPGSYVVRVTALKNTSTQCAAPVPFDSAPLVVNPRPAAPTGPVNAFACSTGGGVALSIADPGVGFEIAWSTTSPAFTAVGTGTVSGTRNVTYTPATSATATFFAFTRNSTSLCLSTSGTAVTQTQDVKPANAVAGPAQPLLCGTTATLAATPATNSGQGTWTVVTGTATIAVADIHNPAAPVTGLVQNAPGGAATTATLRWTVRSLNNVCASSQDDVVLTVNPLPIAINPAAVLCEDAAGVGVTNGIDLTTYNNTITASAATTTVTWTRLSPGATTPLGTTPALQNITSAHTYSALVTNSTTTCTNTVVVTFTVSALPAAVDRTFEFCEDAVNAGIATNVNLTALEMGAGGVTNGGTAATRDVEWYEDNGSGGLGALIVGGTNPGEDQKYNFSATKVVHAKVINLTSPVTPKCFDIADVTLRFKLRPQINPIVGPGTVCTSGNTLIYQINKFLNNYGTDHRYTWTVTGTASFTLAGGGGTNTTDNFQLIQFPGPTTGSVTITVTEIIDGCAGDPNPYNVAISTAPPALSFLTAPTQVCKNSPGTTYELASPNPTSTYSWTVVGGTILGPSSGIGLSTIGVAWGNLITPQPSVRVTETNTGGCSSTPVAINITLNDNPAMNSPASKDICSGSTPHGGTPFFSATIPSSFAWKVISVSGTITTGGVPVPVFPAPGSTGTGDINQVLVNTSGFQGSVIYEVVPITLAPPNCQGPAQQVVIRVNADPVVVPNQMKTICNNTVVGKEILLTPANLPAGTTFSWPDPDAGGPLMAQSGIPAGTAGTLHINDVINNTGDTPLSIVYEVTGSNGLCDGDPENVTITVEPTPKVNAPINNAPTICSTQAPNFEFTTPTVPTVATDLTFDVILFSLPSGVVATGIANTGVTGVSSSAMTPYHFNGGTLTNNNISAATVVYRIIPKLNGCANGTFQAVSIVVEPLPTVVATNNSARICNGGTPDFSINSATAPAVSTNLTFDILSSIPAGITATGNANTGMTGVTKASLPFTFTGGTLTNTTDSRITVTYEVVPKLAGCTNGPPQFVNIVVDPTPKANIPVNLAPVICNAGTPNFNFTTPTVVNTASDLTFDVTINTPLPTGISGTGIAISGITGVSADAVTAFVFNAGTLTNSSTSVQTVSYTITPKLNGCIDGPTRTVNVKVQPVPSADVPVNNAPVICNGQHPDFQFTSPTVANAPGDVTFDVTLNTPLPAGVTGTGLAFTGATGVTATAIPYVLNSGTLSNSTDAFQTVTYKITPKLNGCANGTDRTVTVKIEPTPKADLPNNIKPVICNGGSPEFSFTTPTSPTTPADLTFDIAPQSLPPGVTGTGLTVSGATATSSVAYVFNTATLTNTNNSFQTVTFVITPKLGGCVAGPTRTVDVKVEPTPAFTFTNPLPTICNGGTPNISVSSSTAPVTPANLTFNVGVTIPPGVTGTGVAFNGLTGTTAPFFINSGTLVNNTNVAKTVVYRVTPKLAGCADGAFQDISVTIEPTPRATFINHAPRICNGLSPDIEVNTLTVPSVPGNLTFEVTVALNGVIGTLAAGNGIPAAVGPQFFINTGTLTNPTNAAKTVTYTITPKLSGCVDGPQQIVNVIVEPTPTATAANIAPRICTGGTPNILITSSTSPSNAGDLTFNVVPNFPPGGFVTGTLRAGNGVTGATAPFSINTGALNNSDNTFKVVEYVITPLLNGCPNGTPQSVFVTVEPTPQADAPNNQDPVICNNGHPDIEFTSPTTTSVATDLTFDVALTTIPSGVSGSGDAISGKTGATAPFSINSGTLSNSTNQKQTVEYRITPKINGCADGPVKFVSVIVEPTPVATFTNAKPIICSSESPNITITSPTVPNTPADLKFDVSVNAPGLTGTGDAFNGVTNVSAGYIINTGTLVHDNLSNVPVVVTYTITPKLDNTDACSNGTPVQVTVTVRPIPVGVSSTTAAPAIASCSRDGFTYDIQADNIDLLGNHVASKFFFTVTSSNEPQVPTPAALDRAMASASSAGIIGNFTNKTNADVFITYHITPVDISANACTGLPFDVVAVIHPEPKGPTVVTNIERCSGLPINYNLQTAINDIANGGNALANSQFTYAITAVSPSGNDLVPNVFPGNFGRDIAGISNAPISETFRNLTNHDVIITYVVTPYSADPNRCDGSTFTLKVTYHPEPVGVDFVDPVCATTLDFDPQTLITNNIPDEYEFTYTVVSDNPAVVAKPDRTSFSKAKIQDVYTNNSGTVANVRYRITARSSSHLCLSTSPVTTFDYTAKIFPTPVASSGPLPSKCSDPLGLSPVIVNPQSFVTNGVTISSYKWKVTYPALLTGAAVGALPPSGTETTGATGNISFAMVNRTTGPLTVTFEITPSSGSCPGNMFTITVPIDAEPVMSTPAAPPPVCSNDNINVTLTTLVSSAPTLNFIVTATKDAALTGTPTTGTALAANAIFNDHFENKTSISRDVIYKVTPRANNANACLGAEYTITVTIRPEPVLDIPNPPDVCSSNAENANPINVTLATNGASVNVSANGYQVKAIQYSTTGIGGPFSAPLPAGFSKDPANAVLNLNGSNVMVKNDKYTNTSNVVVTVRYTIQGQSSGGCFSTPQNFFVNVNPEPTLTPGTFAQCSGIPLGTGLTFTPAPLTPAITSYFLQSVVPQGAGLTAAATNQPTSVIYTSADFLKNDVFFNATDNSIEVWYTIVPITADGCKGLAKIIKVSIGPAPLVAAGLDAKTCSGSTSEIVLKDNSASNPSAVAPFSAAADNYRIVSIKVAGATPALDQNITPGATVLNLTAGTGNATAGTTSSSVNVIKADTYVNSTNDPIVVKYEIIPIALGCEGSPKVITLTVEPPIKVTPVSLITTCSGDPVNIPLNSPSNPTPNGTITFNYSMVPTPGVTGSAAGNNVPEGFSIPDQLINNNNSAVTVQYNVTAFANGAADGKGCNSLPATAIFVKVEPRPKLVPTKLSVTTCEQTAVSGVTLNSPTVASAGNGSVIFTINPATDIVDVATGLPVAAAVITGQTTQTSYAPGDPLVDVLENHTDVPQTIRYTFTPRFSAGVMCVGNPVSVEVTVTPRPDVVVTPGPLTICSGDTFTATMTDAVEAANPGTTLVSWTAAASSADIVGASAGVGSEMFQTLINKGNTIQTVTYKFTSSLNGCPGTPQTIVVTVNPQPRVTPPAKLTVCGETVFTLDLTTLANTDPTLTTFKWEVTDVNQIGATGEFDNTTGTGTIISETFVNNTSSQATLIYQITPIFGGCEGLPRVMNVVVAPTINGGFISTDEFICEGTPVFLTFDIQGQAPFEFTYRATDIDGNVTEKTLVKTGNVKVEKVTPLITTDYEIISIKDGLGCVKPLSPAPKVTMTVFKKITANWVANIPPFVGGNSTVAFTNASDPVDGSIFRYEWTFGTDSSPDPLSAVGEGPFNVNYDRPGDHFISLHAVNTKAEAVGQSCESTFAARITIPVLPLVAAFKASPDAACFPQNIVVTENTSTGDSNEWRVIDSNGRVIAISSAPLPEFLITAPGKYTITLKTFNAFTGQTAFAPSKDVTIYANPVASFDLRPLLVYVPDTELTTFNFSTGAPEYLWDFGDGGTSTEKEPKYFYKVEGKYDVTLMVINDHGDGAVCTDTLKHQVIAKQGGVTKVPNAFTPSPNGPNGGISGNNTFNDVFLPLVRGAEEFNMQIFDRWGNLIFESNNSNVGWDGYDKNGRLLPAGVYVYKLTLRLSDGQRSTQIGDITMIR